MRNLKFNFRSCLLVLKEGNPTKFREKIPSNCLISNLAALLCNTIREILQKTLEEARYTHQRKLSYCTHNANSANVCTVSIRQTKSQNIENECVYGRRNPDTQHTVTKRGTNFWNTRTMSTILRKAILHSYKSCVAQSRRNFVGLTKSYQKTLDKRPYLVQAVQAGILMGAGDLCAQKFFSTNETVNIDYIRTLKFCSIGFVFVVSSKEDFLPQLIAAMTFSFHLTRVLVYVYGMV